MQTTPRYAWMLSGRSGRSKCDDEECVDGWCKEGLCSQATMALKYNQVVEKGLRCLRNALEPLRRMLLRQELWGPLVSVLQTPASCILRGRLLAHRRQGPRRTS